MGKTTKASKPSSARKSSVTKKSPLSRLPAPRILLPLVAITIVAAIGAWLWIAGRAQTPTFTMTNTRDRLVQCKNANITLTIQSSRPASGTPLSNCTYTVQNLLNYYNQTKPGHAVAIDGWYGSITAEKISSYKWYRMGIAGSKTVDSATYSNMISYMNGRINTTSDPSPSTGWTKPINSTVITQGYLTGVGYSVPNCTYSGKHCAVDLSGGVDYGSPVYAAADGDIVVARTAGQGSCGYATTGDCIVINHAGGYKTLYNHINIGVWSGHVSKGQKIGTLNASGKVTGPHLHFMTIESWGTVSDPVAFMSVRGVKLP